MSLAIIKQLTLGVELDRNATRRLLRALEGLGSEAPGCTVAQAQLRSVLERRDWKRIGVSIDPATVRETGLSIGILEGKP